MFNTAAATVLKVPSSGWITGRSAAAPERRGRRSDWNTSIRRSSRALWGSSGRTQASWPERSSMRSSRGWSRNRECPRENGKVKPAYLCVMLVFQRHRAKEKGEGTLWQLGLSGGGVEGSEEEEEKVNVHIITHLPITCSLLKRAGGEFSLKTSGAELCFFIIIQIVK